MRKKICVSFVLFITLTIAYVLVNFIFAEKKLTEEYVLLDTDVNAITCIVSVTNEDVTELVKDESGKWECKGLAEYAIATDITAVYQSLEAASQIVSEDFIAIEDSAQLKDYGLSPAQCCITVIYNSNQKTEFKIGIKSPVSKRYYITFDDGKTVYTMRGPMAEFLMRKKPAYAALNLVEKPTQQAILGSCFKWNDIELSIIKKQGKWIIQDKSGQTSYINEEQLKEYLDAASRFYLSECVQLGVTEQNIEEFGLENKKLYFSMQFVGKNSGEIEEMAVIFGTKIPSSGNYYAMVLGTDALFEVSYYPIALLSTAAESVKENESVYDS